MRFSSLLAGAFAAVFLPLASRAQEAQDAVPAGADVALPVEMMRLQNGLTVLLAPDAHARLVSVEVSYGAGSADDPDRRRGLAHMVEHLVATGTKHVGDVYAVLDAAGACRINAMTDADRTTFFETVPSSRLDTALWVESERMAYADSVVTEARVNTERAAINNELRGRVGGGYLSMVGEFTWREVFPAWHPYEPPLDVTADLESIRMDDVLAFIHTWYLPANATLAIAGAFDRGQALAAVRRFFDSAPRAGVPARPRCPRGRRGRSDSSSTRRLRTTAFRLHGPPPRSARPTTPRSTWPPPWSRIGSRIRS